MLVYIFSTKSSEKENANKKFEAQKVAKLDNFEKFQYRHELISLKVINRIEYNLEYIILDI